MCGRFTREYTWAQIYAMYSLIPGSPASNLQPRYNICPTTDIDVVVRGDDQRQLIPMRWGLIPGWWSKPLKEMRLATFNARSDTVASMPMFREAFKKRRCLIPASGYYEWQGVAEVASVEARDHRALAAAGLAGRDQWFDEFPLVVGQIARIAQPAAVVTGAVLSRPHR